MRPCVEKTNLTMSYCKKSQQDLIAMKLKPDVSCHLPDVYTRFQLHISKHVEKSSENFVSVGTKSEGST